MVCISFDFLPCWNTYLSDKGKNGKEKPPLHGSDDALCDSGSCWVFTWMVVLKTGICTIQG